MKDIQRPVQLLYAILVGARGTSITRAERLTLMRHIATRFSNLAPDLLSEAVAEALRSREENRLDPMQPLRGLKLDEIAAKEILAAACEVGLSDGEISLEQSLALDTLRERLGVSEETLADLIDEGMLAAVRPYRALGFFGDQKDWSDDALASALERYRRDGYISQEPESDWQYLAVDRKRVWTLDFTGNDWGALRHDPLDLYGPERFEEFRAWAREY